MTRHAGQPIWALISGGGTGGHVFPGLAVAEVLRTRGHQVVWMGTPDSFEARTVPKHGIEVRFVRVKGLRGKGALSWLGAPLRLLRALRDAYVVLRSERPDVLLGMGGFAAGPGGLAAWLTRRPLVIHEQNSVAGLTNKLLARIARRVLEAFPHTVRGAETVGKFADRFEEYLGWIQPHHRVLGSTATGPVTGASPRANFTGALLKQANFTGVARHGARGLDDTI